jgi:N-acetyl-anhydromuramyl-L-alanine amidase AmpD
MPNPREYQFDLPVGPKPPALTIPEMWFPGVEDYWKFSTSKRRIDPIEGIKAVVIHATSGHASSHAVDGMHPPAKKKVSFHWLVPDENESEHGRTVWACVRERDAAWHVATHASHPDVNQGQKHVNHWSLGIEVVNLQSRNDAFSEWQVAITATLVRYCWVKYPNLRHIVSHAKLDPGRRSDPGSNFPWERFKTLVLTTQNNPLDGLVERINIRSEDKERKENASLEEEEANFTIEDPKADELHEVPE